MKKIIITIAIILGFTVSYAQSLEVRRNFLTDELVYIRDSLDLAITSLSVTDNFSWLITYGQNSFSYFDAPHNLRQRLDKINKSNAAITSAELMQDSAWIVVCDGNKLFFKNLSIAQKEALQKIDRKNGKINFLRIWAPDKFVIFFNDTRFLALGISKNLYKNLNKLIARGKKIKDVEVYGNSFIILFGHKGILGYNLPPALKNKLIKLQQRSYTIDLVRHLPTGEWIIIYDRNKFLTVK